MQCIMTMILPETVAYLKMCESSYILKHDVCERCSYERFYFSFLRITSFLGMHVRDMH